MSGLVIDRVRRISAAWARTLPFRISLREAASALATGVTGAGCAWIGIRLAFAPDQTLALKAGALAPALAPPVGVFLARAASLGFAIPGAVYAIGGYLRLRGWWICSPFVWRAVPLPGDESAFHVEERPTARFLAELVMALLAAAFALVAAFAGLIFILDASRIDAELAPVVSGLVNGEVGRPELMLARMLLAACGIVAAVTTLNRGRAAERHFDRAMCSISGEAA